MEKARVLLGRWKLKLEKTPDESKQAYLQSLFEWIISGVRIRNDEMGFALAEADEFIRATKDNLLFIGEVSKNWRTQIFMHW